MSLTQCLPKMTSWLGNHLKSIYEGKLKHLNKEKCYRDSTFSSSHGQRTLPHQESFFYLAPPSCSLHFALLLLMFVMTYSQSPRDQQRYKEKKKRERERERHWDRRQEKGVFKKQEIEVYQKSLSEQQMVLTIFLQPHSFSPCSPFPSFYPATFLLWLQARQQALAQLQLKYVILGNLLKLCEPQIPNLKTENAAVTAAKSLQSCPTRCDPIDGSPPGSPIPGILQEYNTGVGCHCLLKKKMRIIHLKKLLREINVMIYRQCLEHARVSTMLQNFFIF